MVSSAPMMSMSAVSTPAFLSCWAVSVSIMPVWTNTVKPNSFLICAMVGMKGFSGTVPFGVHPPLMRMPVAPFCLS